MTDLIGGIGAILLSAVAGNWLVAALLILSFMFVLGLAMRFTLDCWIATLPALIWTLAFHPETRILPSWLWIIAAIIQGVLIFLGVMRLVRRG